MKNLAWQEEPRRWPSWDGNLKSCSWDERAVGGEVTGDEADGRRPRPSTELTEWIIFRAKPKHLGFILEHWEDRDTGEF